MSKAIRQSFLVSIALVAGTATAAPIHDALIDGDIARALELIDSADIDARDSKGRTPLHYAALLGRKNALEALIEAGADVNAVDRRGETPLHLAARRTQVYQVVQLLEAGAEADPLNTDGVSPLLLLTDATAHSHALDDRATEIAMTLIRRGADMNRVDQHGYTLRDQARIADYHHLEDAAADLGIGWSAGAAPQMVLSRNYRSYAQIETLLTQAELDYPLLAKGWVLGQSVQGRNISALNITSNVGSHADKPRVKLISTMHGDETVGNEMMLFLIDHLLSNYGSDARVTNIVDSVDLWIVPLMNPDGYDRASPRRGNANGFDLNRDFPDQFDDPVNTTSGRQQETAVIMDWVQGTDFTLSANIHTGALVVNYPWDSNPQGASVFSPTDDEDVLSHISLMYAQNNTPMFNSPLFPDGITNGADWFSIRGGMQDWNMVWEGCMEVTLELSDIKNPSSGTIPGFWNDNRESLLTYLEQALIGVRGVVTADGNPAPGATVQVVGREFMTYSYDNTISNYHRMLLPGSYDIRFAWPGYDTVTAKNVSVTSGGATRFDMDLSEAPALTSLNSGETIGINAPAAVTWTGSASAFFDVELSTNFGDAIVQTDSFDSGGIPSDYSFGGNANWVTTTAQAVSGTRSIANADIGDNQTATIRRTVQGPGSVSFQYRTSTESGFDFLNFRVNGSVELQQSGTTGWQSFSTNLPAGTFTLEWEYFKDSSLSRGDDTVYIDDIQIVAVGETWDALGSTTVGATSLTFTPDTLTTTARVRVRANYPGNAVGEWVTSDVNFVVDDLPAACPADVDSTGLVDIEDLLVVLRDFGNGDGGDANGDSKTDIEDLLLVLREFGKSCE